MCTTLLRFRTSAFELPIRLHLCVEPSCVCILVRTCCCRNAPLGPSTGGSFFKMGSVKNSRTVTLQVYGMTEPVCSGSLVGLVQNATGIYVIVDGV